MTFAAPGTAHDSFEELKKKQDEGASSSNVIAGTLEDLRKAYDFTDYLNVYKPDELHLNSSAIKASNDLTVRELMKDINREIKFYDLSYF